MNQDARDHTRGFDQASPEERERASRAMDLLAGLCKDSNVKVSTWQNFSAWKQYVDGKISDPELNDQAKLELDEFAEKFGKYLVIDEESPKPYKDDPIKRARAKLANKIYKKLCEDAGIDLCFFTDFSSWSDYVRGAIGEAEFSERAKAELQRRIVARRSAEG